MRRFDGVLTVSVIPSHKQGIDDFVLLPKKNFARSDILILFKNSSQYHTCKIEIHKIEETINLLIKQFKIHKTLL